MARFPRTRHLLAGIAAALALPAMAPAAPVTIETARGEVTFAETPERIVVFAIAALDTIDALGVTPVGVPNPLYLDHLEHLAAEAEPVGTLFEPDFETVAALEPDLIIVAGRSAPQHDALSAIAPVIDMTITGDEALTDQALNRLEAYGALFGREDMAADLADTLHASLEAAREAAPDNEDMLVVMTNGPKISAYGPGSRFGWLHSDLGMTPTAPDLDTADHGAAISFEFIHETDPDWMLVIDRAAAIGETGASARQTLDNALVAETTAWTEEQIVFLDPVAMYIAAGGVRALGNMLDDIAAAFGK